ncbi:hypothetical protein CesoFtcFv8_021414 [Champsocephalus esox]|uniref:Cytochrome c oxidase assembly protein COX20, mitochondrial n=1 Tax=Champsocephalus esox TaxID=159716 RepID=A0AAN8BDT3_9TELE|nr:hypothetical protein CesoFtcFv8_021414 [Champsocephalus esox]
MAEDEQETKKGFRLLGILDIKNTPCAREAVLHGAGGGGRVKRSFDVGFAGFMFTTLGSWFYCRINNAKLRVQQRMIQEGIKNKVMYEGSVLDPTRRPPGAS